MEAHWATPPPRHAGEALTITDILRWLPLLSAAVWFSLSVFQVYRDRVHTFTESFFLAACFSAGFYAIADWILFNATNARTAFLATLASLSFVTVTVLFLFLFTLVYVDRMRRLYWSFALVAGVVLVVVWTGLVQRVTQPNPGGLYIQQFDPLLFLIFLAYVLVFSVGGIFNLYRVHRIVKASSEKLARRTRGLLITFTLVLVLGLMTNGVLGVAQETTIPPPFSSLLLVVAAATFFTLYPGSTQRVSEVMRRFQARNYSAMATFLIYKDGTLIGAEGASGENMVDKDLFSATLDVIQNFMRTSFPTLRGQWLRTITHGDYTLVIERGRSTYVVLVIQGEESDQLRRQMRDAVLKFEADNRSILATWRGVPSEAEGVSAMLLSLLED